MSNYTQSTWDMIQALKQEFNTDRRFKLTDTEKSVDFQREFLAVLDTNTKLVYDIIYDIRTGTPRTTVEYINRLINHIKLNDGEPIENRKQRKLNKIN